MKVTTKAVYDMTTGELLHWEGYDYTGPVALCGGGSKPDPLQTQAAQRNAAVAEREAKIAEERNTREKEQYAAIQPYAMSRLDGLPFFSSLVDYSGGTNARAFAPARAQIMRQFTSDLPSGAKLQTLTDLEAKRAHAFDQDLVGNLLTNEQAKSEAARLLTGQQQIANPLGWFQAASGTNAAITGADSLTRKSGGIGSVLGGIAGGVVGAL